MRDEATGREVARLCDTTDHGGRIKDAAPDLTHHGVRVVLDQHLVECPKCGGEYPVNASGPRTHGGRLVAFLGDTTACGATLVKG